MTGYLQRLASSVLHPGGSVHPVRVPAFSAPKAAQMLPERSIPQESTTLLRDTDDSETIRTPFTSVMDAKSIPDSPKSIVPPPPSSDPSFLLFPLANGEPSADRNAEPAGNINGAGEPPKSPVNESALAGKWHGSVLAVPETSGATQTDRKDEPHEAMLTAKVSDSEPSLNPSDRISARLKKPWNGVNRSPASNTPSREPDEVEIHIGRIEVTAVQTAAPSAPAKPRRLAPSLDDYLRQRDRRNS